MSTNWVAGSSNTENPGHPPSRIQTPKQGSFFRAFVLFRVTKGPVVRNGRSCLFYWSFWLDVLRRRGKRARGAFVGADVRRGFGPRSRLLPKWSVSQKAGCRTPLAIMKVFAKMSRISDPPLSAAVMLWILHFDAIHASQEFLQPVSQDYR